MKAFWTFRKMTTQERERIRKRPSKKESRRSQEQKEEDKKDWLGKVGQKAEVGEGSTQRLGRDKKLH